jgi:hypothetical protein
MIYYNIYAGDEQQFLVIGLQIDGAAPKRVCGSVELYFLRVQFTGNGTARLLSHNLHVATNYCQRVRCASPI